MTTASHHSHRSPVVPMLALLAPLAGLLIYLTMLDHPLLVRDMQWTVENPQVVSPRGLGELWLKPTPPQVIASECYRPVWASALWMQWKIWGNSSSSFHALNLLLFVTSISLLMLVMSRLTSSPLAVATCAFVYALHPMASQSVLSVSGQGALLAVTASLGACWVALLGRSGRLGTVWTTVLLGILIAIALGSHECSLAATLPWLVALVLLAKKSQAEGAEQPKWRKSGAADAKSKVAKEAATGRPAVFIAVTAGAILCVYLLLHRLALGWLVPPFFRSPAESQDALPWLTLAPARLALGAWRLVWPVHPTLIYTSASLPPAWTGWALAGAAALCLAFMAKRWSLMATGLVFLICPLAGQAFASSPRGAFSEGPLLFAVPGLAILAGGLVQRVLHLEKQSQRIGLRERLVAVVVFAVLAALAAQTWQRNHAWKDAETLWQVEGRLHAASAQPLIEWLEETARNGQPDQVFEIATRARQRAQAGEQMDRAIEYQAVALSAKNEINALRTLIHDELTTSRLSNQGHMTRLAAMAQERGLNKEAELLWRVEIKHHPDSFTALYALATAEQKNKNWIEARALAQRAAECAPASMKAQAMERYGVILADGGRLEEGRRQLLAALEIDHKLYLPYVYLARIYWGRKDYVRAEEAIARGFSLAKVSSYVDLAQMRAGMMEEQGQLNAALDWLPRICNEFPGDMPLKVFAAGLLVDNRRFKEAEDVYKQIRGVQGELLAGMYTGLGQIAMERDNNRNAAIDLWRKALDAAPQYPPARRLLQSASLSVPQAAPSATPTPLAPVSATTATLEAPAALSTKTLTATPTLAPAEPEPSTSTLSVPTDSPNSGAPPSR